MVDASDYILLRARYNLDEHEGAIIRTQMPARTVKKRAAGHRSGLTCSATVGYYVMAKLIMTKSIVMTAGCRSPVTRMMTLASRCSAANY